MSASQLYINVSHKTVTEIVEKNDISGSIWHKSFIQTLKYHIFEDGSFSLFFCQHEFCLAAHVDELTT